MLPPFIIEQIRKREEEEEEKARYEQPRLEIPTPPRPRKETPEEEPSRGVIIVDLLGD
jgi:hypothetical protein